MNMSLIITEVKHCTIDADYSSYHGYYIIKFSSFPYTLQSDLSIDEQVISSSKIVCEGTYLFPISINYHYYVLQKKSMKTIIIFRAIINGNVNVICYGSNDVVPQCLSFISYNDYNTLSPLHIHMKEHDIIINENNKREGIEFERSVSIRTQDTTYDYNYEFWD